MEPVPAAVRRAALRAFDEREPDTVVADLRHDCLRLLPESASRHLEFRSDAHIIDVEVRDSSRGHLVLNVRIRPQGVFRVRVRHTSRPSWRRRAPSADGEVRGQGGGELAPVRRGIVSLSFTAEGAGSSTTQTAWVRL